jgi:hypothetical protein
MALQTHETHAPPATCGVSTRLIPDRQDDERRATQVLWQHHFQRLAQHARERIESTRCRGINGTRDARCTRPDDVAMGAFLVICGRLACANGEERLSERCARARVWRILARLTARLALNGSPPQGWPTASLRGASARASANLIPLAGSAAPAEFSAAVGALLDGLDDPALRTIAVRRIRGATTAEIATELDGSVNTIERKVAVIGALWDAPEESA